jgi:hypothetical protein
MSNIVISEPKQKNCLRAAGILVIPEITSTTLTIRDRVAGGELAASKHASAKAVEVNKKLAGNMPEHRLLQNHRQTVHNGMNVFTFEFAGDQRFLPSPRFERFFAWWDEMVRQHSELKQAFLTAWPDVRAKAAFELGELFDRNDYPTASELGRKFSINLFKCEVPAGHFMEVEFAASLQNARDAFQIEIDRKVDAMLDEQITQIVGVMKSISTCCDIEVVNTNGEAKVKRKRLYDSTLQKALELCNTFDKFNPKDDDRLRSACSALRSTLEGVDITTLRESDSLRVKVKANVDGILSTLSSKVEDTFAF